MTNQPEPAAIGLGDVARSLIRTWTPLAVGALITWLSGVGVDLPADQAAELSAAATAVVSGLYYALVRAGERRWPWLGILLGSRTPPRYTK